MSLYVSTVLPSTRLYPEVAPLRPVLSLTNLDDTLNAVGCVGVQENLGVKAPDV